MVKGKSNDAERKDDRT